MQTLTFDTLSGTLSIENGNSVSIVTNDDDSSPTNEIQDLTFDGQSLSLTLPDGTVTSTVDLHQHHFARPGASFDFPQGILGDHKILTLGIYTVPPGRVFYMTAGRNEVFFSHQSVNGGSPATHFPTPNMPIFKEGTVISNCYCTGFELEMEPEIEPVFIQLSNANDTYTVPAGKVLFLKSGLANDDSGNIKVDGMDIEFFRPNLSRWTRVITFPEGTVLSKPSSPPSLGTFILTGYLIEN